MTKVNRNVPKRRFKEFQNAGDWEERKLGDVAEIMGGGTPSTSIKEYWDGDIDWYTPAEIGSQIFVSVSQRKISNLGLQKSSAKILPVGSVLFTSRAGIGTSAILSKESTTNQGFQSIVPKKEYLDSYFIYSKTRELKKYGEVTGAGSTFIEISGKQMANMLLLIPNLPEQKKIGTFFSNLDRLITLHQRKLDKLKNVKRAYLSELFPAEGEHEPKRRFSGFTDPWEQRKLGEVADRYDNLRVPVSSNLRIPGSTPYYGANGIQDYVAGYTHEGEFVLVAEDGANDLKNYPVRYVSGQIWVNNHAHVIQAKKQIADNKFLAFSIHRANIESLLVGGGRAKLNSEVMMNISIPLPNLDEQKCIGNHIETLNHLIALHQRKLDKLKDMKKAYLNELFV